MNKQQELLYNVLKNQNSIDMLASISRNQESESCITYGIVFFRKDGEKIIPEIGVRVQFGEVFENENEEDGIFLSFLGLIFETNQQDSFRPRKVEIIGCDILKELSVKKCLDNYRHFVWYNSSNWTDRLFEIQDIAEVIKAEFLNGESEEVVGQDLTYLGERVQDVIPYFCVHVHRDGDYSYEW